MARQRACAERVNVIPKALRRREGRNQDGKLGKLDGGFECVSRTRIELPVEFQLGAGYSEPDIRKILGENLLRVAQAVWR